MGPKILVFTSLLGMVFSSGCGPCQDGFGSLVNKQILVGLDFKEAIWNFNEVLGDPTSRKFALRANLGVQKLKAKSKSSFKIDTSMFNNMVMEYSEYETNDAGCQSANIESKTLDKHGRQTTVWARKFLKVVQDQDGRVAVLSGMPSCTSNDLSESELNDACNEVGAIIGVTNLKRVACVIINARDKDPVSKCNNLIAESVKPVNGNGDKNKWR